MYVAASHTHYFHRRLEDAFAVCGLQHSLHERVAARVEPDVAPALRTSVAADTALMSLPAATLRALFATAARNRSGSDGLLALCREAAFVALTSVEQRALLRVIDEAHSEELVADVLTIIRTAGFAEAPRRVRAVLIHELDHMNHVARQGVAILFSALRSQDHGLCCELIRYLAGPRLAPRAAPMRAQRVELYWSRRRRDLVRLLRDVRFVRADSAVQVERLHHFLHGRALEIFFVDATGLNGHSALVFGSPSDPRNLSYGRRWIIAKHDRPVAKIYSPDPSVRSSWRTPSDAPTTRYAFTAYRISRLLELRLLDSVEKDYVVSDDLRVAGLGAQPRISCGQADVLSETRDFLEQLCAGSGGIEKRTGYLSGGKERVERSAKVPGAHTLLTRYLQA